MLSRASSLLMMAVLRESPRCWRSDVSPVHMVHTFQLASQRAGVFDLVSFFTAWCRVVARLSGRSVP